MLGGVVSSLEGISSYLPVEATSSRECAASPPPSLLRGVVSPLHGGVPPLSVVFVIGTASWVELAGGLWVESASFS